MPCADWISDLSSAVTRTGIYELRYSPSGLADRFQSPERDPFVFALADHPTRMTFVKVENVGLIRTGDPVARVIARQSGPAVDVFPRVFQVPAVGPGDIALELTAIRYCGAVTRDMLSDAEDRAREEQERIRTLDEPSNPIARFLEDLRGALGVAGVAAAVLLFVILWPRIRDLGETVLEGMTRAGSRSA